MNTPITVEDIQDLMILVSVAFALFMVATAAIQHSQGLVQEATFSLASAVFLHTVAILNK